MTYVSNVGPSGLIVFLSASLADPGSDLLMREADALRWAAAMALRQHPVRVLAWVTLPAAFQTIWHLPEPEAEPLARLALIQQMFEQSLDEGQHGGLWQHGTARVLRGPKDLAEQVVLCRDAPVAAGLVARAEDWPLSSFASVSEARRVG